MIKNKKLLQNFEKWIVRKSAFEKLSQENLIERFKKS